MRHLHHHPSPLPRGNQKRKPRTLLVRCSPYPVASSALPNELVPAPQQAAPSLLLPPPQQIQVHPSTVPTTPQPLPLQPQPVQPEPQEPQEATISHTCKWPWVHRLLSQTVGGKATGFLLAAFPAPLPSQRKRGRPATKERKEAEEGVSPHHTARAEWCAEHHLHDPMYSALITANTLGDVKIVEDKRTHKKQAASDVWSGGSLLKFSFHLLSLQ
jgi:hypothetical protein